LPRYYSPENIVGANMSDGWQGLLSLLFKKDSKRHHLLVLEPAAGCLYKYY